MTHPSLRLAVIRFAMLLVLASSSSFALAQEQTQMLEPAPGPLDNPLKGLVPYARPYPDRFPHSMEFNYLPLSDLMTGPDDYTWQPLEDLLNDVASRSNQTVVRVFLEYPAKADGIPPFLEQAGLKVHEYLNTNTAPFPPAKVRTPDYESPLLRKALQDFIAAFGARYDDDPRIAYIHAGLLGTWGEWHTYPKSELWASKATQDVVLDAYQRAFQKTPVLLRYPAGEGHYAQTENASRPFGYHDDSFAWATLDTGRREDDWFYVPALKAAGPAAVDKWKSHPIGGEIRPELWGLIFDEQVSHPQAQDFAQCVEETHASWLMDTGMFREPPAPERFERAAAHVRRMGYEFYVQSVRIRSLKGFAVECEVVNNGVAPFYRDWPLEIAVISRTGQILRSWKLDWKLSVVLPDGNPHVWKAGGFPAADLPADSVIAIRVVNPLPGGKTLRFANATQDQHAPGWLTLGPNPGP